MQQPLRILLKSLWRHINKRRRMQFSFLLFLMLISSFAEVVSIGAVIPFLGVLVAPEQIFAHTATQSIIKFLGLSHPSHLLLPLTLVFGLAVIIANSMRLLLLWVSTRLSFAAGADLSIDIYRRTLYQPYSIHCSRNSSEVISGISSKTDGVIYSIMIPFLSIINSILVLVAILIALIVVSTVKIALISFGSISIIYGIIILIKRNQLLKESLLMARETTNLIKALQEGLGGIRDVLIDGSQAIYCKIYRSSDLALRRAQGNNIFIGGAPRYLMEALGMILIATLAYYLAQREEGVTSAIPILGALALGAQRLLPVIQLGYQSWTSMRGAQSALQDTLELLDQSLPEYADKPAPLPMLFKHDINIKQIDFRYNPETPRVLKKINFDIERGSRIGFIGSTGSGKSTLLDIIMGLLKPTDGTIEIDGQVLTSQNNRSWQAHIAHVPQAIYLADSSIEENIAFGVSKDNIDSKRVRNAANQAQIANDIESWAKQYQTRVGERGIQLSGGQRQRIGIARALYKNADVIIFDEATSALDDATEKKVMDAIEELGEDVTLLIIAHRLTTLKNCQQIIELSENSIKQIGSYHEIISRSKNTNYEV